MATLYITEYERMATDADGRPMPVAGREIIAHQTRSLSSSSAQSSAFNARTKYVRLFTDTACFVLFGANPTATTSHIPLAANATEYFEVNGSDKIAARTA